MKKLSLLFLALGLWLTAMSQAPNLFNYQVVVRNNAGQIAANQSVAFRFSIRDGNGSGTILYRETQNKTTNNFGLVTVTVGAGTLVTGAWPTPSQLSSGDKYFQVEMDASGGSSYTDMGATQILSVPYANYANNANNANNALNYSGTVMPNQIGASGASSGQVLKWNGSNWVPAADDNTSLTGGTGVTITAGQINTPWTATGNDISNNNTGNVGIGGAASGTAKLNVVGDGSLLGGLRVSGPSTGTTNSSALYLDGQSQDYTIAATNSGSGSGANKLVFRNYSGAKDIMTLTQSNYVGIGTNSPMARFHLDASDLNTAEIGRYSFGNKDWLAFYQKTNSIGYIGNWNDTQSMDFGTTGLGKKVHLVTGAIPRLTVDGTNVGIGTTSPVYLLDVVSNTANSTARVKSMAAANNSSVQLENDGSQIFTVGKGGTNSSATLWGWSLNSNAYLNSSGSGSLLMASADSMGFLVNGSERMRILSSGNVGIGEKNPGYKLQVTHGGSTGMKVKSTASFSVIDIDAASGDAALRFANNGVNQWNLRNQPSTDNLEIFELGGGGSRLILQNTTGFLGVNTSSPRARISAVAGSGNKSAAYFENGDMNTYDSGIVAVSSTYSGASNLFLYSANSSANRSIGLEMRLKFIGVECLTSGGTTSGYGGYFAASNNSVTNYGVVGTAYGTSSTNYGLYGSAASGTTNYAVYCSGNGVYTGTWSSSSDQNLKTGIENLNQGLDVVMKLRPTSYQYRTDDAKYKSMYLPSGLHFGFIAQELEKVLPSLVSNNVHKAPVGSSGQESEAIAFKAVNYSELIPVLTKAIQEQQAQIEALKLEVEKLKGSK